MTVIDQLVHLASLQSTGTAIYAAGIFPSQRYQPRLGIAREDDNVFFTACIVHILQSLEGRLEDDELAISTRICTAAIAAYPLYGNKDGLDTYNFWRTRPSGHFPNGNLMHRFEHFRIPDDIDDTALIFLTQHASRDRVGALREKLKGHANLAYRQASNTLPEYRGLRAYSTFIGKQMYIDLDVCVLSNLMRLILLHFPSELSEYDRDSLYLICEVVRKGQHLTMPYRVAPQYSTTPLILYHLARLLPHLPQEYADIRPVVLDGLHQWHRQLKVGMEKLLLENALLNLGERPDALAGLPDTLHSDREFFYYIAGIFTAFEGNVVQRVAESPFTHLRFRSGAFNLVLMLENSVLRRSLRDS
ncbi:MAG: hypothetical protein K9J06_08170 [Flavobacteriales bacterium]|nr:hypothetical protein [Flavobacteriales bacterium]